MWPWGGGTLRLPPRETMTFMPQRPYLPLGTLRAAVCYPAEPGQFDEAAVVAALKRVDLGHLLPSLDRTSAGTGSCPWKSSSAWPLRACCCTRPVGWSPTTR